MSTTASLTLLVLGAVAPAPTPPKGTPQARNILFYPLGEMPSTTSGDRSKIREPPRLVRD